MIEKLRKKIFWSVEGSALGVLFFILVVFNLFHIFEEEEEEWEMLASLVASGLGLALAAIVFAVIARRLALLITKPVEETMTAQKQFIADASHELKTPIAVMMANISVLEKEVGENTWMTYIKEEGKRVSELVNSLLTLSRIDYEQDTAFFERENVRFNLSDAILEAALPFESVAFEQGVHYELSVPEERFAQGIPGDIKQLVGILLDNALKNVDAGGTVRVSLEADRNIISVKNTGNPIPKEALPNIFNRFYKADASRQYKGDGFGLGLAIAKALTEKNRGEIAVTSEDRITEFIVCLQEIPDKK
ncbi:MAG: HAMP domain-containing histidine kinase [Acetatifactor sp.]|nr:HAMP domain-containing histidine kinase [Acetatifactor sp.]